MHEANDVDQAVGRMKDLMELRALRPNTVQTYLGCTERFLEHVGKPAEAVTEGDIEEFLLDLGRQGRSARTRNVHLAAIRFLMRAAGRREIGRDIPHAKFGRRVPDILSGTEVARLLAATTSLKYRAIFMLAYGAGLRVGEIAALEVTDIDSDRMMIHVREGKTGDRYVMMSARILEELRAYWREERPTGPELFPGFRNGRRGTRLSRAAIGKVLRQVLVKAGITKRVPPHGLRHCFATHMLDLGADLSEVQVLLGHAYVQTTTGYLQLSQARLSKMKSPLDSIGTPEGKTLG